MHPDELWEAGQWWRRFSGETHANTFTYAPHVDIHSHMHHTYIYIHIHLNTFTYIYIQSVLVFFGNFPKKTVLFGVVHMLLYVYVS